MFQKNKYWTQKNQRGVRNYRQKEYRQSEKKIWLCGGDFGELGEINMGRQKQ